MQHMQKKKKKKKKKNKIHTFHDKRKQQYKISKNAAHVIIFKIYWSVIFMTMDWLTEIQWNLNQASTYGKAKNGVAKDMYLPNTGKFAFFFFKWDLK